MTAFVKSRCPARGSRLLWVGLGCWLAFGASGCAGRMQRRVRTIYRTLLDEERQQPPNAVRALATATDRLTDALAKQTIVKQDCDGSPRLEPRLEQLFILVQRLAERQMHMDALLIAMQGKIDVLLAQRPGPQSLPKVDVQVHPVLQAACATPKPPGDDQQPAELRRQRVATLAEVEMELNKELFPKRKTGIGCLQVPNLDEMETFELKFFQHEKNQLLFGRARYYMGLAYDKGQKGDQAAVFYRRALDLDPDDVCAPYANLGLACYLRSQKGKSAEALIHYTRLLADWPRRRERRSTENDSELEFNKRLTSLITQPANQAQLADACNAFDQLRERLLPEKGGK
jgi:hypothetical protein